MQKRWGALRSRARQALPEAGGDGRVVTKRTPRVVIGAPKLEPRGKFRPGAAHERLVPLAHEPPLLFPLI